MGDIRANAHMAEADSQIGLPLTLLQMPPSAAACVLELGMSHLGEIALLADICQPTV
jgi:UDP-N-acetylmuramyl pentapeptide synthase